MATINVNGHELDPASQQEGGKHFVPDASQSNFILLQCHEILQHAQYKALEDLQCYVQGYINPNTYLCRYEPADLERLRSLPFIVYANVYHSDLAQRPSFAASIAASQTAAALDTSHDEDERLSKSAVPDPGGLMYNVYVGLHDDSGHSTSRVKQTLADTLRVDSNTFTEDGHRLHMTLKTEDIPIVAGLDDVKYVERDPFRQLFNDKAREILRFPPHAGQLETTVFSAAGETIAVADTGLDNGTLVDIHPSFAKAKIAFGKDYTKGTGADDFSDTDGHGTHVCGSIVGDSTTTFNNGSADVQLQIQGTAPQAQLLVQKVVQEKLSWSYLGVPDSEGNPLVAAEKARIEQLKTAGVVPDPTGTVAISMSGLLEDAYGHETKARIQNLSWGNVQIAKHQAPYDSTAYEFDRIVIKYPDYLIVVAAGNAHGNDGFTSPTIDSQGAAKNIITVGGCQTSRPLARDDNRRLIYNDDSRVDGNPDMIYYKSSQGPTVELRQKPDIVAPAMAIYSARPKPPAVAAGANAQIDVDGESLDSLWYYSSGTSMAAPLVSGCAAVVRNQLKSKVKSKSYSPSAALVKAILLNTATDISRDTRTGGQTRDFEDYYIPVGPVPDVAQGFGRLHMTKAIENITDQKHCAYFETGTSDGDIPPLPQHDPSSQSTAGIYPLSIPIKKYFAPTPTGSGYQALPVTLHVTLVYSDPPGVDLVNLLQLTVTATDANGTDQVKTPLRTVKTMDSTGSSVEFSDNNVQKVVWERVPSETVRINVKAVRVFGINAVQHFALALRVVYGRQATLTPDVASEAIPNEDIFKSSYDVYPMRRAYGEWMASLSAEDQKALQAANAAT